SGTVNRFVVEGNGTASFPWSFLLCAVGAGAAQPVPAAAAIDAPEVSVDDGMVVRGVRAHPRGHMGADGGLGVAASSGAQRCDDFGECELAVGRVGGQRPCHFPDLLMGRHAGHLSPWV